MLTAAGQYYQLDLRLTSGENVSPSWLVAAVTATYPQADVAEIPYYDGTSAVVLVRWRQGAGEINEGDTVIAGAEGIQLPAGAFPSGTVLAVSQVELVEHPADVVSEAVEDLPPEYNAALKLTSAAALLVCVVYLSGRIRRKYVDAGTVEFAAR